MKFKILILAAILSAGSTAYAQDQDVYDSFRNKLGLLRYCQAKGFIDAAAVESSSGHVKAAIATLPAPGDPAKGDAAETAGEAGKWGHTQVEFAQYATMMGVTEEAQCKEWVK